MAVEDGTAVIRENLDSGSQTSPPPTTTPCSCIQSFEVTDKVKDERWQLGHLVNQFNFSISRRFPFCCRVLYIKGILWQLFLKNFLNADSKAVSTHESAYFWNRIFFIWILGDVDLEPLFTTCTSPKMHLICPPKFCISIVFNFPWDGCNTQGEMENKGNAKFWRANKLRCGRCAMANGERFQNNAV